MKKPKETIQHNTTGQLDNNKCKDSAVAHTLTPAKARKPTSDNSRKMLFCSMIFRCSFLAPQSQVFFFKIIQKKRGNCTCCLSHDSRPSHCLLYKDKQRRKPTPILYMSYAFLYPIGHRKHIYTNPTGIYRCLSSCTISKLRSLES